MKKLVRKFQPLHYNRSLEEILDENKKVKTNLRGNNVNKIVSKITKLLSTTVYCVSSTEFHSLNFVPISLGKDR